VQHEYYGYDEGGRRVAKAFVSGGSTVMTYYPFAHYEQTGSTGAGVTKYYFFAGERFALRTGTGAGVLRLLYTDRISSTVHVTDQTGNFLGSSGYYAFGATLRSTGTIPTDRRFTDQQLDGTGLYYYGARYYDPTIGHFISPDTLVPDPTNVMDYQRYMYTRGNPLKYNDPTEHIAVCLKGGAENQDNGDAETNHFYQLCTESLASGGYQSAFPGNIVYFGNGNTQIAAAELAIRAAIASNANQPVLIVGYSWGRSHGS